MPALTRRIRRALLVGSAAALTTALLQVPAHADLGDLGNAGGGEKGGNITATAGVQYDRSKNGTSAGGHPAGPLTPVGTWKPPACWYEPYYTPAQLKAERESVWAQPSVGNEWVVGQRDHYENGKPYTDFNMDKTGKGYWWYGYVPNPGAPGWDKCQDPPFWVDKGDPPPAAHHNVITPDVLAQLAYNEIRIPTGDAAVNPAGSQGVNIPTWVWMDTSVFHPVSVTAYLPDYNVSATTTAKPASVRIRPLTKYAQTYPASGTCKGTGTQWTAGAGNVPPCGILFLKDSGTGTFTVEITVTWTISWVGTGQTNPKGLPTGTFTNRQTFTVKQIQAVNR